MTWLAMMVGEFLLAVLMRSWLDRRCITPPPPAPADDDEPLADYWRVYEDLEDVETLLAAGRAREARDAIAKLLDVMDGRDEAALVDARWAARKSGGETCHESTFCA